MALGWDPPWNGISIGTGYVYDKLLVTALTSVASLGLNKELLERIWIGPWPAPYLGLVTVPWIMSGHLMDYIIGGTGSGWGWSTVGWWNKGQKNKQGQDIILVPVLCQGLKNSAMIYSIPIDKIPINRTQPINIVSRSVILLYLLDVKMQ